MKFSTNDSDPREDQIQDGELDVKTNRISSIEEDVGIKGRKPLKPVIILTLIAALLIGAIFIITTYILKGPNLFSTSKNLQKIPFEGLDKENPIQSNNLHVRQGIETYEKGYMNDAITEFTGVVESDAENRDKAIALLYLGIIQGDKGKHRESIDFYNRALTYDRSNPVIYKNLSQAYRYVKDYPSAIETAEKSLSLKDDDINSRVLLGNLYYELGKYRDAIGEYDKALALSPDKPAILYNKASAFLKTGDEVSAMEYFQKAGENDRIGEVAHKAYSRLGVLYTERNLYDSAEDYLKKAVAVRPQNALNHYNLGIALLRQKKTREAVEEFTRAEELGEDNADMLEGIGEAYFSMKNFDRSLDAYNRVMKINTRNIRILSRVAEIHYEKGDLDKAYQMYSKITAIEPVTENARIAYLNMGNILDDTQRFDEAIAMYQKALSLSPKDDSTYYNLGLAFKHAGRPEKAIDAWKKGMDLNPEDPKHQLAIASFYYERNFFDLAEQEYGRIVTKWPHVQEGHFKLATILYKRKEYANALKAYERVIELNEKNELARIAFINTALIYPKVNKDGSSMEKSRQILEKALLMKPGDPDALFSLGILHSRKGECDKAIETFYQVLKATSESGLLADTYNNIGRCQYKKRQYKKALQAFSRGIEEDPMNEELRMNRKAAQQAYEAELASER